MNEISIIPDISVVILCYRSGNFAPIWYQKMVDVLTKHNLNYEIVLVGNYRPNTGDITPEVLRNIAASHDRIKTVIEEKVNPKHGMGWDMRMGLMATTGRTITVIDGDGQMPPEDIPRLFETLTKENLDLCKARRITRGDGLYRKFISAVFNGIMQLFFPGIITKDINGKPKIFTRQAFEKLQLESNDWFIDAEIMIKARRLGFRVGEVETHFHQNPERQSFISFKANIEFIKNILTWRIKEFRQ